jgi:hypothetical protein
MHTVRASTAPSLRGWGSASIKVESQEKEEKEGNRKPALHAVYGTAPPPQFAGGGRSPRTLLCAGVLLFALRPGPPGAFKRP